MRHTEVPDVDLVEGPAAEELDLVGGPVSCVTIVCCIIV